MFERMDECGPPLLPEDIRDLETRLRVALPEEFKEFLLKYNGGRPTPDAFPFEGLENNPYGAIQVFFRIGGPIESSTFDWNMHIMEGRLPAGLFPIACDGGGDLICLSLSGDDAGAVVFWDSFGEPKGPSYSDVYRIADSFTAFLDGLQPLPEDW